MINYLLHTFKKKTLKDEMHEYKHHTKTFHYINSYDVYIGLKSKLWTFYDRSLIVFN